MTKRNLIGLIIIAVVALAIDQISKLLILKYVHPGDSVRVIGDFTTFVLTRNKAGVFGLNFGRGLTYFVFPALGILLVVLFASSSQHFGFTTSYGLILGGAFGNLIDRVFRPAGVVDFIQWRLAPLGIKWSLVNPWFVFNFADMCLIVGIILLLIFEIAAGRRNANAPAVAPSSAVGQSADPVDSSLPASDGAGQSGAQP
jgi:signal peptidase II